jgi:hypothetical protein
MTEAAPEAMIERRLRTSAALVMSGLLVELFSFGWAHPTAFLVFVLVGGLLMAAGIGWYLVTLLVQGGG